MDQPPAPDEIARDARWLAQALDAAGLVRLVEMDRGSYRAASFLDDRMLQAPVRAHVLPWSQATAQLGAGARDDARWIFHIGHVGSTLISRLLGELDGILGVREPRLLRDLVALGTDRRNGFVADARRLLSRTFANDEFACVKATSFVSEIAAELVPGGRALFVFARPAAYLGTILAGENSLRETAALHASRRARVQHRAPSLPDDRRPALQAASAWACEMTALEAAAHALGPEAVRWVDFDAFLADPATGLSEAARFLGIDAAPPVVEAIAGGPLFTRYSKALEYEYSPALRAELIAEATAEHSADVAAALAMLEAAAQDSPLLARALERAEAER